MSSPCEAPRAALEGVHLQRLRPLRIQRKSAPERTLIPQIRESRGTPFALTADEERFVYSLLGEPDGNGLRKHNLWVFRVHQQKFAGDFVLVDLSSPLRPLAGQRMPWWDVFVLDLKMNAPLKLGGGGAGVQLRFAEEAAEQAVLLCAQERNLIPSEGYGAWRRALAPRQLWRLTGDREELLSFFHKIRPLRRHLRRARGDLRAVEDYHRHLHDLGAAQVSRR